MQSDTNKRDSVAFKVGAWFWAGVIAIAVYFGSMLGEGIGFHSRPFEVVEAVLFALVVLVFWLSEKVDRLSKKIDHLALHNEEE